MHGPERRHGYGHESQSLSEHEHHAFAYHLRRYRQWYGKCSISQRGLAMIAHVSRHFVEDLEKAHHLQGSIEPLVRVALALRRPVEELIAPETLRELKDDVERRRKLLGGDAALPEPAHTDASPRFCLAVAYRSPYLLMALSDGRKIIELRQRRLPILGTPFFRMRALIEREAKGYAACEIIVEADTKASDYVFSLGIPHRTIAFRRAKQVLSGTAHEKPPSNRQFFQALIESHPELARYVKVLSATGRVAMSERWRTARLTVASLALSSSAATAAVPPRQVTGTPRGARRRPQRGGTESSHASSL